MFLVRVAAFCICVGLGSQAFALCVSTEKTNLRAGPGPKNKITWVAPKYTPLLKIGGSGSWYQVQDQDGEKHWVYARNVTSKFTCVAIKVDTANIRTGPSSSSPLGNIQHADRYTPFKRVDIAENGWYQILAPWGGTYWISPNLVWRPVRVTGISY